MAEPTATQRAAQEVASRVRAMTFVYPTSLVLVFYGAGLLGRMPVVFGASLGFSVTVALLRRWWTTQLERRPLSTFLWVNTVLGVLATLQFGLIGAFLIALDGLQLEVFIAIFASFAMASGSTSNLAPSRALQLTQLVSLMVPAAVALLVYCPQDRFTVTLEVSLIAYVGFMVLVGRRIHQDYMLAVTQQVRLEHDAHELERARAQAEDSSRAKGEFLANMSHEIRTPLNGVLGMAQVLATTELTAGQRESVNVIVESGEGLLAVLSDVLDFSKIESRKLSIEPVSFSPSTLARQVSALLEHAAKPKGLQFELHLPSDVPSFVRADAMRVRQVLINIVSNAVKFTERGAVSVRVTYADDALSFSVQDTGPGMSAQTLQRLFTPFTQGDASTTRRYGGTGLGLAISHQLAHLMGGTLTAESEEGRGSRFTLRVPAPVVTQEQPVAPVPTARRVLPNQRPRVLVAEDNVVNQRVAVKLLENLGCEPHVAGDGVEVLRRLGSESFDLVLMDCQMPKLDGYEATRVIRVNDLERHAHVPIVGMTASAIEGDKERALAAGMDGYLTKPVKLASLLEVVERYCGARELVPPPLLSP